MVVRIQLTNTNTELEGKEHTNTEHSNIEHTIHTRPVSLKLQIVQILCWLSHVSFVIFVILFILADKDILTKQSEMAWTCKCQNDSNMLLTNFTFCCLAQHNTLSHCVPAAMSFDTWMESYYLILIILLWFHVMVPIFLPMFGIKYFIYKSPRSLCFFLQIIEGIVCIVMFIFFSIDINHVTHCVKM